MRRSTSYIPIAVLFLAAIAAQSHGADTTLGPAQQSAVEEVDRIADTIKSVNQSLWKWAEVGLQEVQSSKLLVDKLREGRFRS